MRIIAHVPAEALDRINTMLPADEIVAVPSSGPLPTLPTADVLVTTRFPWANLSPVLESTAVSWVHLFGTGVDGFPLATTTGRQLTCSRGASAVPIAEWCVAVMLAFEKRIPEIWIDSPPAAMNTANLGGIAGRTVGIVGMGSIGTELARRLIPFGCGIVAARRTHRAAPVIGVELVSDIGELWAQSDHIVLAAPATPHTRDMVDSKAIGSMRRGTHLVNVARGSLVDDAALRDGLDRGVIARASLDATEPEPLPAGHWMYAHPAVRISPHIASISDRGMHELASRFVENVERRRRGTPLKGVVDVEAGY